MSTLRGTASVYFTVVTRGARREVDAYLYDHSEVIGEVYIEDIPGGRDAYRHLLIRTAAEGYDSAEATVDRARYLGQYQAERLASGLHSPSQVYDLQSDAVVQHRERTGVEIEPYVFA